MDVHPDKKLKQAIDNRVTALQEKQQAQAEQEKVKVQKETEKLQAEADAQIELTKAEADAKKTKVKAAAEAENTKIKAKAQAEANNELSASITDELIKMTVRIICTNIYFRGMILIRPCLSRTRNHTPAWGSRLFSQCFAHWAKRRKSMLTHTNSGEHC